MSATSSLASSVVVEVVILHSLVLHSLTSIVVVHSSRRLLELRLAREIFSSRFGLKGLLVESYLLCVACLSSKHHLSALDIIL